MDKTKRTAFYNNNILLSFQRIHGQKWDAINNNDTTQYKNRQKLKTHASLVCLCISCKFLSNFDRFEFCPSHWGNSGRPTSSFVWK